MEWFVLVMVFIFVPTFTFMWHKDMEEREELDRKRKELRKERKQLRRERELDSNNLYWLDFHPTVKGQWIKK